MKRHADAEALAAFNERDLSTRKAARISSHLAGCRHCRRLREDLTRVTAQLAGAPAPPMPDYLAARITSALTAESARRATHVAEPGRGRSQPRDARRRRPRLPAMTAPAPRWTVAGAAAALVIGAGTYVLSQHQGASSGPSASALSGAAGQRGTASGRAHSLIPATGPVLQYTRAGRPASFTPIASGTDFVPATLRTQAAAALTVAGRQPQGRSAAASERPTAASPSSQAAPFGGISVPALEGCVTRIAAGSLVLLVDVARFQNGPATVIVTAASPGGTQQVWVVGTGCSAARGDVLLHTTLVPGG